MAPDLVVSTIDRKSVFCVVCDAIIYQLNKKSSQEIRVKI